MLSRYWSSHKFCFAALYTSMILIETVLLACNIALTITFWHSEKCEHHPTDADPQSKFEAALISLALIHLSNVCRLLWELVT